MFYKNEGDGPCEKGREPTHPRKSRKSRGVSVVVVSQEKVVSFIQVRNKRRYRRGNKGRITNNRHCQWNDTTEPIDKRDVIQYRKMQQENFPEQVSTRGSRTVIVPKQFLETSLSHPGVQEPTGERW